MFIDATALLALTDSITPIIPVALTPCPASKMAPSTCDQKKAEIVRRFENQCLAENKKAKAIYELKCLEVQEKYEGKKKQACLELKQQELNELTEIKNLHEAEMEPVKAKHEEERSAIRQQYGVATPEIDPHTSVTSGPPSSPTLVAASVSISSDDCRDNGHRKPNVHIVAAACWPAERRGWQQELCR